MGPVPMRTHVGPEGADLQHVAACCRCRHPLQEHFHGLHPLHHIPRPQLATATFHILPCRLAQLGQHTALVQGPGDFGSTICRSIVKMWFPSYLTI